MGKLYISINKDKEGALCHQIFQSKSKTTAKDEMRDQGFTPKLVLCWQDVDLVKRDEFIHKDLTESLKEYIISHAAEWVDIVAEM